jgi:cytochrome c oxidase subunit II
MNMGKLFAVVLTIITLVSAYFVIAHTWWMPVDISVHGPAVDRQLEETMLGSGILFVLSQLVLAAFVFMFGDSKGKRKMKSFPGGPTPLIVAAIVLVGIEILTLSFVGSKVWASIYFTPPEPGSMQIDVQAEQFAFYFRYAGPDGQFGGIHPDKIDDGSGNYFGLDPANDVAARDDIISASLTIPVNKPILLTLHAKDVGHSFYVRELRLQQDFVPGIVIPIHFTATQTGKYEIVCTQLCGLGHYNMKAYLEVLPQDQFDQWLKSQSQ